MSTLADPISESSWQGYVSSTQDALLLFEAAKRGHIPKIRRRLRDNERKRLIKSGQIFLFEERESGIKRWTDGLLWSPSRILQNFLVYRQIDRKPASNASPKSATPPEYTKFPSIQEQEAMGLAGGAPFMVPNPLYQQQQQQPRHFDHQLAGPSGTKGSTAMGEDALLTASASSSMTTRDRSGSLDSNLDLMLPESQRRPGSRRGAPSMSRRNSDLHRSLVGSLTNSYPFVEKGLCKKTISIEVEGAHHHLISYYSLDDVYAGKLRTPASMPEFLSLSISPIFLAKSNFRVPPHIETGPDGIPRYRGEVDEVPTAGSNLPAGLGLDEASMPKGSSRRPSRTRAASAASATTASRHRTVSEAPPMPHEIGGSSMLPLTVSTAATYNMHSNPYGRYEPYPSGLPQGFSHSPAVFQDLQSLPFYPTPSDTALLEPNPHQVPTEFGKESRPVSAMSAASIPSQSNYEQASTFLPSSGSMPHSNLLYMQHSAQPGSAPRKPGLPQLEHWAGARHDAPTAALQGYENPDATLYAENMGGISASDVSSSMGPYARFAAPAMEMHASDPTNAYSQHHDSLYDPSMMMSLPTSMRISADTRPQYVLEKEAAQEPRSNSSSNTISFPLEKVVLRNPYHP
ncbi:hypothetical protein K437DRAFT_85607 [Tilletiaria anomala UBC 951]|uniref:Gti1/Pac2 family-domain-containing protein n=1 Tax=Tilletiaria anomala (strain ATCC 24038 / CBS 436.72 / UBC 951) TaxID=1037660 RepID=A0A066WCE4_TILAU|nr:uncharacterized protein K437DRAFT_85607 [Tilletiaria anomala UBC 951]KDN48435.1 hypothetical protein K437DRAFT_85607 [Tilletiaria anomala UBC 951]